MSEQTIVKITAILSLILALSLTIIGGLTDGFGENLDLGWGVKDYVVMSIILFLTLWGTLTAASKAVKSRKVQVLSFSSLAIVGVLIGLEEPRFPQNVVGALCMGTAFPVGVYIMIRLARMIPPNNKL